MPKRKRRGSEWQQRKSARERMRERRQNAETGDRLAPDDLNTTVPCGTHEAVMASPSNVLGQVSMGRYYQLGKYSIEKCKSKVLT